MRSNLRDLNNCDDVEVHGGVFGARKSLRLFERVFECLGDGRGRVSDAREESIQKRHVALYSMAVACTALGLVE